MLGLKELFHAYDVSLSRAITPAARSAGALDQRVGPVSQIGTAQLLAVGSLEVLAVVEEVPGQLAAQELVPLVLKGMRVS